MNDSPRDDDSARRDEPPAHLESSPAPVRAASAAIGAPARQRRPTFQPLRWFRDASELACSPFGGSGSSLLERDHRHWPEQDRAALLVDLKKGFTIEAEGASGFSRQGHSPVWAHGNYASHAPPSIRGAIQVRSNRPIVKLPLDRLANHQLSSAVVMSRSVLTNSYVKGAAAAAIALCPEREARIGQPAHQFPTVRSQATWMFALRLTP